MPDRRLVATLATAVAVVLTVLPATVNACDCCARNVTALDCGAGTRLEARLDCFCCSVCAVEKGGKCDSSDRPCRKGLECSGQGECTDEKKCRSDGECASDRFCLGGVCFDPCTILDPCNSSLKNGICRTRNHRPVCSCPQGFTFQADQKACLRVGCEDDEGRTVDVGERIFRKSCEETCVCGPGGRFNCTQTVCPPGFYLPGTFKDDPDCTELTSAGIAGGCCVNVICAEPDVAAAADDDEGTVSSRGASANEILPTTKAAASAVTTAASTTSTTTASTTSTPNSTVAPTAARTLDMQPLAITHNSTVLQLPSIGGELNYQAQGGPPKQVQLKGSESVITVSNLQPGTSYTFTWQGEGSSKILSVNTRPGCVTNVSSHAIGETYHMGCQSTCVCGGPNQPSCRPRCSFTRGTVTDLSCSERPDIDDPECCVQLVCAVTSSGGQIVDQIFDKTTTPPPTTTTTTTTVSTTVSPSTTTTTAASETTTTTLTTTTPPTTSPSTSPSTVSTTSTTQPPPPAALKMEDAPKPTLIVTTKSFSSVTLAWDDFKPPAYIRGYVAQYRRTGDAEWHRQTLPPQSGQSVPLVKVTQLLPATEYEARVSIYDGAGQALGDSTETIRFVTDDGCSFENVTYPVGGQFHKGCEETCYCELRGKTRCVPRCQRPLFRQGYFSDDPLCFERIQDECCAIVACASAPEVSVTAEEHGDDPCSSARCGDNYNCEVMQKNASDASSKKVAMCVCPVGFHEMTKGDVKQCLPGPGPAVGPVTSSVNTTGCTYGNETYQPGDKFFDGCDYKCLCNSDEEIECQARCPARLGNSLQSECRLVPDPEDACCKIQVCDDDDAVVVGIEVGTTVKPAAADDATTASPVSSTSSAASVESTTAVPPAVNSTLVEAADSTTEAAPETVTDAGRVGRLDDGPGISLGSILGGSEDAPALAVTELRPQTPDSTQLKLHISYSLLDSILSAQTLPVIVQWRHGEAEPWQQKSIGIDDISVEALDTLVMTVPGMARPRESVVRVRYDGEVSEEVRGVDVVPPGAESFATDESATENVASTQGRVA